MKTLSGDPYAGAYRAYLMLHPDATGEDWESWLTENNGQSRGSLDNFEAFAQLCRDAEKSEAQVEPAVAKHIAYAAGHFEAMERVVSCLVGGIPISPHIPHHLDLARAKLVNPEAQFE